MTIPTARHKKEMGFGLVETLIAVAVIATMAAMAFEGISLNAQTTRMMTDRRAAVMIAKSALDMGIVGDPALGRARTGVTGAYQWRIETQPYDGNAVTALSLDVITVTVFSARGGKPMVQLRTLRLVR